MNVTAMAFGSMKKSDQRRVKNDLKRLSNFKVAIRTETSWYARVDRDERILLIGSALGADPKWLDTHPRWSDWLGKEGITAEHCLAVHREWFEREMDKVPSWRKERE